jgi:hypothetical protein
MPLPFDATMKDLVQSYPQDWLAQFDVAASVPVTLLNVDLSTISAATDIVLGHGPFSARPGVECIAAPPLPNAGAQRGGALAVGGG